jgi:hypothetical protein
MTFDRNKDGKLTKKELPQRMHHLIDLGDTNKDGVLDRDELKKLAATLARAQPCFGGRSLKVPEPLPRRSTDCQNQSPSGLVPIARVVSGHAVY